MNNHKKFANIKTLVGISLSLTVMFSASLLGTPHAAYAESQPSMTEIGSALSTENNEPTQSPSPSQPQSSQLDTANHSSVADRVLKTGEQFMGVPYKFGSKTGNTSSFDCSSFTQYVFKQVGINLPRSSKQQATSGSYVPRSKLQAGDLIFTDTNHDGTINHVSIYMGDGRLLHTYRVGIGVAISTFAGSAWDRGYVTARRVI